MQLFNSKCISSWHKGQVSFSRINTSRALLVIIRIHRFLCKLYPKEKIMLNLIAFVLLASSACASRLDIIGGKDVDTPGKYPWQVGLLVSDQLNCGGALISDHWVLTAAHCLPSSIVGNSILVGAHDVETRSQGNPVSYQFSAFYGHPGFIWIPEVGYDIGLVYIEEGMDVESNGFAGLIDMAEEGDDFLDASCVITGWGRTRFSPVEIPDILQEADVTEVAWDECEQIHGGLNPDAICISGEFQRGSCHGDSGGPFACRRGDSWVLAGITSWGDPECSVDFPSVYTRVSMYRDWIKEHTGF